MSGLSLACPSTPPTDATGGHGDRTRGVPPIGTTFVCDRLSQGRHASSMGCNRRVIRFSKIGFPSSSNSIRLYQRLTHVNLQNDQYITLRRNDLSMVDGLYLWSTIMSWQKNDGFRCEDTKVCTLSAIAGELDRM